MNDFQDINYLREKFPDIEDLTHIIRIYNVTSKMVTFRDILETKGYLIDQEQILSLRSLSYESCLLYGFVRKEYVRLISNGEVIYSPENLICIDFLFVKTAFLFEKRKLFRAHGLFMEPDKTPNGRNIISYRNRAYHGLLPFTQSNVFDQKIFDLSVFRGNDVKLREFNKFWLDKLDDFSNPLKMLIHIDSSHDKFRDDSFDYMNTKFKIGRVNKEGYDILSLEKIEEIVYSNID